jgi:glycosyltransferase involved in cell wall biosynthesis
LDAQYFEQSLGNDIGRGIGAKHATGDILLFLDGDIVIPHYELLPFVHAIQKGYDIALNDLSWLASLKTRPHYTTACKLAVNSYLRQSNLFLNSLIAVPHAIKLRIMGDHLEAISYLIRQSDTDSGFHDE